METYITDVKRTENRDFESIKTRINDRSLRLLHASLGVSTESNEFLDMLKKHIYYGKTIDYVNLQEEIGDILFYCAVALDELNISFESVMSNNIEKLKKRYPEKFTSENALNRNIENELSHFKG